MDAADFAGKNHLNINDQMAIEIPWSYGMEGEFECSCSVWPNFHMEVRFTFVIVSKGKVLSRAKRPVLLCRVDLFVMSNQDNLVYYYLTASRMLAMYWWNGLPCPCWKEMKKKFLRCRGTWSYEYNDASLTSWDTPCFASRQCFHYTEIDPDISIPSPVI